MSAQIADNRHTCPRCRHFLFHCVTPVKLHGPLVIDIKCACCHKIVRLELKEEAPAATPKKT